MTATIQPLSGRYLATIKTGELLLALEDKLDAALLGSETMMVER